jgi:hypothetical protein
MDPRNALTEPKADYDRATALLQTFLSMRNTLDGTLAVRHVLRRDSEQFWLVHIRAERQYRRIGVEKPRGIDKRARWYRYRDFLVWYDSDSYHIVSRPASIFSAQSVSYASRLVRAQRNRFLNPPAPLVAVILIKDCARGEHRTIALELATIRARKIVELNDCAVPTLQFSSSVFECENGRRCHEKHGDFCLVCHTQVDDLRRRHFHCGWFFIQ